jgi:aerobic carbon-monoxide dehydrogenase medium subunit
MPKVDTGVYLKHVRRSQDWATVAVAATRVDGGVQVGLAGMGPTPLRARAAEQALADGASAEEAAARAAEGADPPSDVSGSAEYRAHLARVLTRQALERL